jgi:hypothetical protein
VQQAADQIEGNKDREQAGEVLYLRAGALLWLEPQGTIQWHDLPIGTAMGTAIDAPSPVQGAQQGGYLARSAARTLKPSPTVGTGAGVGGLRGPAGEFVFNETTRDTTSG